MPWGACLWGDTGSAASVEMTEEERSQDALTAKIGQVRHLVLQQWKRLEVSPWTLCGELCGVPYTVHVCRELSRRTLRGSTWTSSWGGLVLAPVCIL